VPHQSRRFDTERNVFRYLAYGLGIHSEIPLPELTASDVSSDVILRCEALDWSATSGPGLENWVWFSRNRARLLWPGAGRVGVRDGKEIVVDVAPDADEQALRLFLLGPVLSILLQQRGLLVLHASAVSVGGGAVAFLGASGWGKSTTAASLHALGHSLVADDNVAISLANVKDSGEAASPNGGAVVLPAFPQIKLWPDSALALRESVDDLPRLHPEMEKRAWRAAENFDSAPLPLRRVYVLHGSVNDNASPTATDTFEPSIELLRPREACMELVKHTYCTPLVGGPGGNGMATSHFAQCADLAQKVAVCRLYSRHATQGLSVLPRLANLILDDLEKAGTQAGDPARS
jgi:hypothetical protein